MKIQEFLPNRLNHDAVVFCGCTMKEMQIVAIMSFVICAMLLGILTKLLFGMSLIGVGLAFPSSVGVAWLFAKLLQRAKRDKPKGYMKQQFYLWLDKNNLLQSPYVLRSGKWSVGRYF